jgi:hypothetical protein
VAVKSKRPGNGVRAGATLPVPAVCATDILLTFPGSCKDGCTFRGREWCMELYMWRQGKVLDFYHFLGGVPFFSLAWFVERSSKVRLKLRICVV